MTTREAQRVDGWVWLVRSSLVIHDQGPRGSGRPLMACAVRCWTGYRAGGCGCGANLPGRRDYGRGERKRVNWLSLVLSSLLYGGLAIHLSFESSIRCNGKQLWL